MSDNEIVKTTDAVDNNTVIVTNELDVVAAASDNNNNNNVQISTTSSESITSLNFNDDDNNSVKSTKTTIKKPSGIKPPSTSILSRIGRPCQGHHQPKAGPPPITMESTNEITTTSSATMRRQSDEYLRSNLPDVFEESEADLVRDISNRSRIMSGNPRSSKSKSPELKNYSKTGSSSSSKSDQRKISNGSNGSDLYWEATGRRRSSDHGVVLTDDTDSFIIGQRVWVGGIRPGHIAYIGETHFAPGDWAGVVLDDANGKNDGCVSGKRYFQCEPKRGIFSRLTRLTREQLVMNSSGSTQSFHPHHDHHSHMNASDLSMNQSSRSIQSSPPPSARSGTVSPTNQSLRSYSTTGQKIPTSSSKTQMAVGDRVIVSSGLGSRPGILQFMGETKFAPGNWCGVQLDEPTGKNDGSVDGFKYFDCPPSYGIFVPLAKVTLSPSSRKTQRLSRSGSKESLASVGTFASIQSTATSRLRMSAQHHLSSSSTTTGSQTFAKPPITKPKNAFSLQDVLREKQNHIEQLLLEKDLDRQDAEHQSTLHQKTINQCQERIKQLEQHLDDEKRRADDLQFNIDEVTCGEELSIHLQEYKDRILQLETQLKNIQITVISSNESKKIETSTAQSDQFEQELERLQKELRDKTNTITKLKEDIESNSLDWESKLKNSNETSVNSIRELDAKINYYKLQNDQLLVDLQQKDVIKENEYLNMKHIENELREDLINVTEKLATLEMENKQEKLRGDSTIDLIRKELIDEYEKKIKDLIDSHQLELSQKQQQIAINEQATTEKIQRQHLEQIELIQLEHQQTSKLCEENYQTQIAQQQINFHRTELELNENLTKLQNEIEFNLKKITEQNQLINDFELEKETNLTALKTIEDKLKIELELSKNENEKLINIQNQNHIEIEQLKMDIQKIRSQHTAELNELNSKCMDLNGACQSRETELIELKLKNTQELNEIVRVEMEKNQQKITELEMVNEKKITKYVEDSKKQYNSLETQLENVLKLKMELQTEITQKDTEIIEYEKKLKELELKSMNVEEIMNARELENNNLKIKLENIELDREKIVMNNQQLQEIIKNLQSTAESDSSSQLVSLQETRIKLLQITDENEKLQKENGNLIKINEENLNVVKSKFDEELILKNNLIQQLQDEKNEMVKNSAIELENTIINLKSKYSENIKDIEIKLNESEIKRAELMEALEKLESQVNGLVVEQNEQTKRFNQKETEFTIEINNLNTIEKSMGEQLENAKLNEKILMESIESLTASSTKKYDELLVRYRNTETMIIELEKQLANVNAALNESHHNCVQLEEKINNQNLSYQKSIMTDLHLKLDKIITLELELPQQDLSIIDDDRKTADRNANLDEKLENILEFVSQLQKHNQMLTAQCTELKEQFENRELELEKLHNNEIKLTEERMTTMELNKYQQQQQQQQQQYEMMIKQLQLSLDEKSNVIKNLQKQIESINHQSNNLSDDIKNELQQKNEELQIKDDNILRLTERLNAITEEFKEREHNLEKSITERDAIHHQKMEELTSAEAKLNVEFTKKQNQQKELIDKEKSLKCLNEEQQQQQIKSNSDFKEKLTEMEQAKLMEIEMLTLKLKTVEEQMKQQTIIIENFNQTAATAAAATAIDDKLEIIKRTNNENEQLTNENEHLNRIVQQLNKQIGELQSNNEKMVKKILELENIQPKKQLNSATAAPTEISQTEIKREQPQPIRMSSPADDNETDETGAQISFLNSIIADMQKKNVTLLQRIESLEGAPLDFMNNGMFQLPSASRRLPAPRLFCDICDEFDSHDTEDCPLQSSNNSPPYSSAVTTPITAGSKTLLPADDTEMNKERKLPPPRLYCENCETFDDHETQECSITF